ncbi:MAG: hypothetical protein H7Y13_03895 [Sphingobacteriaceae bacterium]|nr:hypothetical protein [Sphingobacteriaceae bacterium]
MEYSQYLYHIEDGQASFDETMNELKGVEGEIIKILVDENEDYYRDVYILYIDENYVECVGDIERSFPQSPEEHDSLKHKMLEAHAMFSNRKFGEPLPL